MRRRIWCETVPHEELAAPATVALLARYGIDPILAVWDPSLADVASVVARYESVGLSVALWPMLSDAAGRWANARTLTAFSDLALRVATGLGPRELVVDLEPPIHLVREALAGRVLHVHRLWPTSTAALRNARLDLEALLAKLHAEGTPVSAAVAPAVLLDPPPASTSSVRRGGPSGEPRAVSERWLGTPVDGLAWDGVATMLYTSMLEGWSHRIVRRADAISLLSVGARAARTRFGERASIALGVVGPGAFGNEPSYRDPAELAEDVAVATEAGVNDLSLFDLGGVLRRPPAEAWLDAFTEGRVGKAPQPTTRTRLLLGVAEALRAALSIDR